MKKKRGIKMAKNWTVSEVVNEIMSGNKNEVFTDAGKRFPNAVALINGVICGLSNEDAKEAFKELMGAMPDWATARKIEGAFKAKASDDDSDEDEEEEKKTTKKARKTPAKKTKKASDDDDEEDDDDSDYDEDDEEEEVKKPARKSKKASAKKTTKKSKKVEEDDEDDDDDWDI